MKILFVDENASVQDKWIEPLRGEGWGVVRARSTDDAEKIFEFHGDSLSALVVSETFVSWAEKWNYPYIVLMNSWREAQVVKHQNSSSHPAVAYLDYDSKLELVKQAITESKNKPQQVPQQLKATGTSAGLSIELDAPMARASSTASDPSITTARSESQSSAQPANSDTGVVISFDQYANQKIELESTSLKAESPKSSEAQTGIDLGSSEEKTEEKTTPAAENTVAIAAEDRTMMLDVTKLGELGLSDSVQEFINEKPEFSQETQATQTTQTTLVEEDVPEIKNMFSPGSDDVVVEDVSEESVDTYEPQEEVSPEPSYSSADFTPGPGNKDLETMKNYLALREQDVAMLTGQMRSAQERVQQLEMQLKVEKARGSELQHVVQKQEQQIKNFDRDKEVEFEVLYQQVEDLNLQLRERTDKVRTIEAKLKITTDEVEKVKERVRVDIRRIRVREKELEGQLEILKKDSTALLVARDDKILELKRKIDLLEFNMELVQEQYGKERNNTEQLRHKLKEAAGVMKRAGGLLDSPN